VGGKFRDSSDVPICDTIVLCTFERLVKGLLAAVCRINIGVFI
jgi:hypothetical protein